MQKRFSATIVVAVFSILAIASLFKNPAAQYSLPSTPEGTTVHATANAAAAKPPRHSDDTAYARITRVIDGDTIEIEGGARVRYIGMDAPESVDPRRSIQCFGAESSAKNKELTEGKLVRLEKDISETDRYGRLLRYVYVGDTMINLLLVREGYAHAATFPPDVKYQREFLDAEREARERKRGLWASCPVIKQKL